MSILSYFRTRPKTSADEAKERLQILLAHERAGSNRPDYLPKLQAELMAVLWKQCVLVIHCHIPILFTLTLSSLQLVQVQCVPHVTDPSGILAFRHPRIPTIPYREREKL